MVKSLEVIVRYFAKKKLYAVFNRRCKREKQPSNYSSRYEWLKYLVSTTFNESVQHLNVSWDFITFKLGIFLSNNTTTMLVGNYFDHSIQLQMIRKSIVLIYAKLFQSYTSAENCQCFVKSWTLRHNFHLLLDLPTKKIQIDDERAFFKWKGRYSWCAQNIASYPCHPSGRNARMEKYFVRKYEK